MRLICAMILALLIGTPAAAENAPALILLKPDRVFDGASPKAHDGWTVLVRGDRIEAVGPAGAIPEGATVIALPGTTLMPGMIEGHSHLFLHPYNETSWDDQVLHEPLALRTARATVAAKSTLMAGFTTTRDLGTEGAGYADVGLKAAIEQGIVPGPRMLVATRALVATGAYGPKGYEPGVEVPQGAEEADGPALVVAVRRQIAAGADVVKLYTDYRWRPGEPSRATFSLAEITAAVEAAHDAGRIVAAHAQTVEGMRRAILGGVDTVEHGGEGTPEIFKLMRDHGTRLLSHPRRARCDRALSRLERQRTRSDKRRSGPQGLCGSARGGSEHLRRRRCRRLRAWRQRPRGDHAGGGGHAHAAGP